MSFTILDVKLRNLIVKILRDEKPVNVDKIKDLLEDGANPKAEILHDEFSAYDLVSNYNDKGQYNAILEEFDRDLVSRSSDSDWEGMHS
jgi:hypothetical protein